MVCRNTWKQSHPTFFDLHVLLCEYPIAYVVNSQSVPRMSLLPEVDSTECKRPHHEMVPETAGLWDERMDGEDGGVAGGVA